MNERADFISIIVDYDDWGWTHAFFKCLIQAGVVILLIVLPHITMHIFHGSIAGSGHLAARM